jgi:hypothetical protein
VYTDQKQKREMFKCAARLFYSEKMPQIVDACAAVGLDIRGADWGGVKYYVQKYAPQADLLATVDGRARCHEQAAKYGWQPPPPLKADPTADEEKYAAAVMHVGKLMSGKRKLSRVKAVRAAQTKFGVKVSNSTATWAKLTKGKQPPLKKGKSLMLGDTAEAMMVQAVQMLRYHRLPTQRSIVLSMANNMADELGLEAGSAGITSDWFRGFKDRHEDLFAFEKGRGLETARAEWLTASNIEHHYRTAAEVFVSIGAATLVADADSVSEVVNGEIIHFTTGGASRFCSFDEARTTLDTYEDPAKGKSMTLKSVPKSGRSDTLEVRGCGNVTVVAGSRGDGMALPPMCIFPRKTMNCSEGMDQTKWGVPMWQKWAAEAPVSPITDAKGKHLQTLIFGNESGGMTHDLGAMYLEKCIAPAFGKHLSAEQKCAVLCDGHGSHLTLEFLLKARELNIVVILRPPHTTSRIQTEDQTSNFGVMQAEFRKGKTSTMITAHFEGRLPSVWDYMTVLKPAFRKGFSQENCLKAWRKIGIVPFTRCVMWDLLAEEKALGAVKRAAEQNDKKAQAAVEEGYKFEEMHLPQRAAAALADLSAGDTSESGDEEDDFDPSVKMTSTVMWKRPATAKRNVKMLMRRAENKTADEEERTRKREEKDEKSRKKARAETSVGTTLLQELLAAKKWELKFDVLKSGQLDGIVAALQRSYPKGKPLKKDEKRKLVRPWVKTFIVEEKKGKKKK